MNTCLGEKPPPPPVPSRKGSLGFAFHIGVRVLLSLLSFSSDSHRFPIKERVHNEVDGPTSKFQIGFAHATCARHEHFVG